MKTCGWDSCVLPLMPVQAEINIRILNQYCKKKNKNKGEPYCKKILKFKKKWRWTLLQKIFYHTVQGPEATWGRGLC